MIASISANEDRMDTVAQIKEVEYKLPIGTCE